MKAYLIKGPLHRKVSNSRNSYCGSMRLDHLDWKNWWSDGMGTRETYIHVTHIYDGTVHRVFSRLKGTGVRIAVIKGELTWLIDR